MKKEKRKTSENNSKQIMAIVVAALLIITGGMIFLGYNLYLKYLVYLIGAALIGLGAYFMLRFITKNEYQKSSNFGFSFGSFLVLTGSVSIIRASDVLVHFLYYIGVVLIIYGFIILQNTVSLIIMECKSWIISLIFALISIAFSLIILLDIWGLTSSIDNLSGLIISCVGILFIVSFILYIRGIKNFESRAVALKDRNMEEAPLAQTKDDTSDGDNLEASIMTNDDNNSEASTVTNDDNDNENSSENDVVDTETSSTENDDSKLFEEE